jgi:hypothetical protein
VRTGVEDPLIASARREALATMTVWLATMIYTVSYCYTQGYHRTLDDLTFVLGFPDWIFWGIVVPWGVCFLLSAWFSFFFIRDEPLGREQPQNDAEESPHG